MPTPEPEPVVVVMPPSDPPSPPTPKHAPPLADAAPPADRAPLWLLGGLIAFVAVILIAGLRAILRRGT